VRNKTWEDVLIDNVIKYYNEPIFIPFLTVKLLENLYGSAGGHLVSVKRSSPFSSIELNKFVMRYNVVFDENFDFGLGGKFAGDCPTGGSPKITGWSVRPMWKNDGNVIFYIYHPKQIGKYGDNVLTPLKFVPGKKHSIELIYENDLLLMRIDDFEMDISLNGKPSVILYHVFRGGHSEEWTSPRDGYITISPI